MNILPALNIAVVQLPDNVKNTISYSLLVIIAVAAVMCVAKCINGANALDRGEEGKMKIMSGIMIGMAPWLGVGAFQATGLWNRLGVSLVPNGVVRLPTELIDVVTYTMWAIIGFAVCMCVAKVVNGSNALDRGEEGKMKIFSGLAIGAAPWIAILALNMSGFWDALGLQLI